MEEGRVRLSPISFLQRFPRELRDKIYEHTLVVDGTLRRIWHRGAKPVIDINIMLANHQTYDEAFQVLYRLNTFSVPWLAFSSNVDPNSNPWLPRNSRPTPKQLAMMRRLELNDPLGALNVFYFDIKHLQTAWEHRTDIRYLSFKGIIHIPPTLPDSFEEHLGAIRKHLSGSFFTFRNVVGVQTVLTIDERTMPKKWSEWEMARCWEDWAEYLRSMREVMESKSLIEGRLI